MNPPSRDQYLPDWQDVGAYDYCMRLTSRGWAWEFLRRNPAFQDDLEIVLRSVTVSQVQSADVVRLPTDGGDLTRWGLLFCRLDRT